MCLKIFKEECVFLQYKDKCFKNARTLKSEIIKRYKNVNPGEANDIYTRIVNYQVKKYGGILRGARLTKAN